jgi:hypothetical protein
MSPPLDHLDVTASTDNNENVLDSLTSEFEAARLALPDPEGELFRQYLNKLERFHPFPKLPLELRTMIWRYAFPRGRKVLYDRGCWREYIVCKFSGYTKFIRSFTPPPAVFLVNKESRAIALSAYIRILPLSLKSQAATYLHLDLDTFVIKDNDDLQDLSMDRAHDDPAFVETLGKIQYLEMSNSDPRYLSWCWRLCCRLGDPWEDVEGLLPTHFKNLRKLVLEWPENPDPSREHYKEYLKEVRDDLGPALKLWFERKREATGDYKVPEIIFHP